MCLKSLFSVPSLPSLKPDPRRESHLRDRYQHIGHDAARWGGRQRHCWEPEFGLYGPEQVSRFLRSKERREERREMNTVCKCVCVLEPATIVNDETEIGSVETCLLVTRSKPVYIRFLYRFKPTSPSSSLVTRHYAFLSGTGRSRCNAFTLVLVGGMPVGR